MSETSKSRRIGRRLEAMAAVTGVVVATFLSPGDWNGDNLQNMVGVRSSGALSLYEATAAATG